MAERLISTLRDFPSIEELLQEKSLAVSISRLPRPLAAEMVKETVAALKIRFKEKHQPLKHSELCAELNEALTLQHRRSIGRVINGTGILVHTNLGRAPLDETYFDQIKQTVTGYGNVEFDSESGERGKRGIACEQQLALLSGSEAATVVNNCAAALFVTLNTLANRKKVIISRGELVQIGGGFRIPDILKRSGARLCEVGTTNITSIADYEAELDDKTALILKVHKSNFVQAGFTEEVDLKDLVTLGRKHGLPVVNDLGSGAFVSSKKLLGYEEPTVQQSVRTGADLTLFSGDKMLGGPQAGLIVGSNQFVAKIKKNPIFRTIRVDKIVLAMLEHLVSIYLDGTHAERIKLWQLLAVSDSEQYKRARKIAKELGQPEGLSVEATSVFIGGGIQPSHDLPSVGLVFAHPFKASHLAKAFRRLNPPVLGRIESDRFILDLKAIDEIDLHLLTDSIKTVLKQTSRSR
jgi:L-seryl-tRNA(Ser) seleniumtransferase